MITLQELLESRDARAAHQGELLAKYPGCALLCLTVQLPGPQKRSPLSLKIARAGVEAVRRGFVPLFEELRDLETGFEGYFVVEGEALQVKKAAALIEETHPLGRLLDLDVIGPEGPLERAAVGLPERQCLLCGNPARVCIRAKTHSTRQLLDKIEEICAAY